MNTETGYLSAIVVKSVEANKWIVLLATLDCRCCQRILIYKFYVCTIAIKLVVANEF